MPLRHLLIAAVALVSPSLAQAQQRGAPPEPPPVDARPPGDRPAMATVVAEPIALFIAGADRASADGRTTLEELRRAVLEATSADPPWMDEKTGERSVSYIRYADWCERWLGDRNALPSPFEIDRNGDNRVAFTEFSDRMEEIFARLDANNDGAVTRAELLTIRNAAIPMFDPGERRRRRR